MRELDDLQKYRPNVGICLFNKAGDVWLGERLAAPGSRDVNPYRWQMPQGGIDKGESAEEAAFRELHEETGVRSARLLFMTPGWLAYDFPPQYRRGERDWKGQRQKWAVMLFEGDDSEINLEAHEPAEFERWQWCPMGEIEDKIVPFKRQIYAELTRAFGPFAAFIAAAEERQGD